MPQNNPCVTNGFLPPDIYTQNLATQLTYNIDFDFVAEEDVVVFREQPAGTFTLLTNSAATGATPPNYTINQGVSPAQVTFNTGEAPGGVSLVIGRRTDICDPVVTYQVGAAIRAGDLNASNIQLLHLIQELRSVLGFMINGNSTDPIVPGQGMDLNDLDDVNVGDPVNPDPALLRYNGTDWVGNTVLQDGDAWVSNDTTFATTAAGDDRWLQLPGPGGNFTAGAGIEFDTTTPNQVTIAADLAANGGLEFSAAGNAGEIQVDVGEGLVADANGLAIDLANPSGLEFNGGDLRIDTNLGCEIVAAGLNAETTAASIVQTGGTDDDPAIRIATTLGTATTNTDLAIVGGANTTVTRDNNNQLTISSATGVGTTYRGLVDVTDDATLPANALVNDLFANDTQGNQTANWQTVITGPSTTANQGDLLLCTTAAGGVATDARYTLIESGTEIPAANVPNLQNVTDQGAITTNAITLDDTVLQITEANDTLAIGWPVGTANRTITFPDADGEVALAANIPGAPGDGQINVNAGNGLVAAGNNATANQAGNTTRTLTVQAADNTINVAAGGISVNAANLPLDARYVAVAGDTMTGNLVMDDANITGAENAITAGAGNWDLDNGNFWTLGAVVVPDPTNMAEGISGLIVNTAAATWPAAGGATFQYAANTPPNITEFPAVIPFYCTNNTTIFIGTPTVNIV